MIQAKELRINNLVKVKISNDARIYTIVNINGLAGTVGLDGVRQGEVISTEKIKPIQLTEEILLKCGFQEIYRSEFSIRFELPSNQKIEYKWNCTFGWNLYCETWCIENINTLHQLQNAIYFLTGKELEVKL